MKKNKILIKTKSKKYPLYVGNHILKQTNTLLKKYLPGVKKIAIITDNKIPKKIIKTLMHSLKNYETKIFFLKAGEKSKNIKTIFLLTNQLLKYNFNRSDCIIALGGGVVGDISSLTSNLTKRGTKFVNVPTTLLEKQLLIQILGKI